MMIKEDIYTEIAFILDFYLKPILATILILFKY